MRKVIAEIVGLMLCVMAVGACHGHSDTAPVPQAAASAAAPPAASSDTPEPDESAQPDQSAAANDLSNQNEAGEYTGPNPCSILTLADANEAMGYTVVNAPHPGTSTCQYQTAGTQHAGEGVTLEVNPGGREKFAFARDGVIGAKPVEGIPDAAFEFVSVAGFAQVYVIKRELYFTVTLTKLNDPQVGKEAIELARKVAARQP
ncbi:MAG TPA: hypothetical protein VN867_08520 [Candidatus Binataceae bacterium]|nr:hypothetical protein [Candidatus Binataceae bacterium]